MRCGCLPLTTCLCAAAAGDGLTVSGSGVSGSGFTPGVRLAIDPDQAAVVTTALLVPTGGPRTSGAAGTLTQTSALTFTTTLARSRILNGEVWATVQLAITSAGSGTTTIIWTPPTTLIPKAVTATIGGNPPVLGRFGYFRTGTGWSYGHVYNSFGSFTSYVFIPFGSTAINTGVGGSPAFNAANGDKLDIVMRYETTK